MRENLRNDGVPRVEYDHRAREARLRSERVERLLVWRVVTGRSRSPYRLLRFLAVAFSGNRRRGDQSTGSSSVRRPCGIPAPILPARCWSTIVPCR